MTRPSGSLSRSSARGATFADDGLKTAHGNTSKTDTLHNTRANREKGLCRKKYIPNIWATTSNANHANKKHGNRQTEKSYYINHKGPPVALSAVS